MPYCEVRMIDVKDVLRLWLAAVPKKRIAETLGLDRKTVRRYSTLAAAQGLSPSPQPGEPLTDAHLEAVLVALKRGTGRPHGEGWERCVEQRAFIDEKLKQVKLSKLRRLPLRQGVDVPYATLHRFAIAELGYGRAKRTIPVADAEPRQEVQLDPVGSARSSRICSGNGGASARGSSAPCARAIGSCGRPSRRRRRRPVSPTCAGIDRIRAPNPAAAIRFPPRARGSTHPPGSHRSCRFPRLPTPTAAIEIPIPNSIVVRRLLLHDGGTV